MPALVVIHGNDRGQFFNIPKAAALVVGRDESLLARLRDTGISRRHIEFIHHQTDGKCYAVDLQSRNGARINSEKLDHSREMRDGDIIQVGHTLMVFVNKDLDEKSPVDKFLAACEKLYGEHLKKMRDHEERRSAVLHDQSTDSQAGRTSVFGLGTIFGKKAT